MPMRRLGLSVRGDFFLVSYIQRVALKYPRGTELALVLELHSLLMGITRCICWPLVLIYISKLSPPGALVGQ